MKTKAIILGAGMGTRMGSTLPKVLHEICGRPMIDILLNSVKQADIDDITVVVGYKAEMFQYLADKYGIDIVYNEDYYRYNNTSSIIRVVDRLSNTFICSSDNYFPKNVFHEKPIQSYYSALYADGLTDEYCLSVDDYDNIIDVTVGGSDSWYMVGHVYFSNDFSEFFSKILVSEYDKEETKHGYWEDVYLRYIQQLPLMKIHRYKKHDIEEFDSIDELRLFDDSYVHNTRSSIIKSIANQLDCSEADLNSFTRLNHDGDFMMFTFVKDGETYRYNQQNKTIQKL